VFEGRDRGGHHAERDCEGAPWPTGVGEREAEAQHPERLDVAGGVGDRVHDERARLLVLQEDVEEARQERPATGQGRGGGDRERRRGRGAGDGARGAQDRQARTEQVEEKGVQVEGRRGVRGLEVGVRRLTARHAERLVRDDALVLHEEAAAVEDEKVGQRREEDERDAPRRQPISHAPSLSRHGRGP
jgi:hypothetical protein